jgi:hypothetical protein
MSLGVATHAGRPEGSRWIQSPPFDLALFILSPISGVVVVLASQNLARGAWVLAAATYLVAIPHYLSTFTFYLGDDTRAHYLSRRAAFVLGPAVILGAVLGLRLAGWLTPVLCAMFVWNIYHVALQSAGILSLYRRLNGGPETEKPAAHLAILSVSAAMAFWHIDRFAPLSQALAGLGPGVPGAVSRVSAVLAIASLVRLAFVLARRGRLPALPEAAFLATSLTLFHPYLWVQDSGLATFAMLMGHFVQYLAIVWLLHGRKYDGRAGSRAQRALGRLGRSAPLLLGALAASGTFVYVLEKSARGAGAPEAYLIFWNALTLVHFYLDGLIWAFRNPFVRQSIGAHLTPSPRRMAA